MTGGQLKQRKVEIENESLFDFTSKYIASTGRNLKIGFCSVLLLVVITIIYVIIDYELFEKLHFWDNNNSSLVTDSSYIYFNFKNITINNNINKSDSIGEITLIPEIPAITGITHPSDKNRQTTTTNRKLTNKSETILSINDDHGNINIINIDNDNIINNNNNEIFSYVNIDIPTNENDPNYIKFSKLNINNKNKNYKIINDNTIYLINLNTTIKLNTKHRIYTNNIDVKSLTKLTQSQLDSMVYDATVDLVPWNNTVYNDYQWGHIYKPHRVWCNVLTMWPERKENIEVMMLYIFIVYIFFLSQFSFFLYTWQYAFF